MRDLIDSEDGENRAVRAFLMHYGTPGLTVGQMKENMRRAGWPMCWPTWVQTQSGEHLTKAGAQDWLRHLFSLEPAGVKAVAPPATLPESMSRDEMLRYYSEYANMVANEVTGYQKQIRDLKAALAARGVLAVDQRQAFEAWAAREGYPVNRERFDEDVYQDPRTHAAWWAWKEARGVTEVDRG